MFYCCTAYAYACRGAAEVTAGLPLVQRSYLGVLLPESLLHMLESYGPGVFAAALAGDHATPEIIWTAGMRQQRLIPAMLQVGCAADVPTAAGCSPCVESSVWNPVCGMPLDQAYLHDDSCFGTAGVHALIRVHCHSMCASDNLNVRLRLRAAQFAWLQDTCLCPVSPPPGPLA